MTDWSKTLIRCSSLGDLLTEPKNKSDKDAGNLSKTAQTMLIRDYVRVRYDRTKEVGSFAMEKGTFAEENSIDLLSKYLKRFLKKNEERLNSDYLTGLPDIFEGENIIGCDFIWDIKTCQDIWTFLDKITGDLDTTYYRQLQGYMALTGCKKAAIAYCLTDTPEHMIVSEKRKLMYQMNVISEESPEYLEAAAGLELNLIYPDIDISEKVLIFPVERDEQVISKIYQKVEKAREFLSEFEQKHKTFNDYAKNHFIN